MTETIGLTKLTIATEEVIEAIVTTVAIIMTKAIMSIEEVVTTEAVIEETATIGTKATIGRIITIEAAIKEMMATEEVIVTIITEETIQLILNTTKTGAITKETNSRTDIVVNSCHPPL